MAIEVLAPPLGQTTDRVILANWYKQEGDIVNEGEPLFAVETDKATLDVEAHASGILRGVKAKIGDEVKVLSVIAMIAAPDEELALPGTITSPEATRAVPISSQDAQVAVSQKQDRIFISPRARRLAEENKISLDEIHATGPEGAIIERDIRLYMERPVKPPISPVARRMAEEAGMDWRHLTGSGPRGRVMSKDISAVGITSAEKTARLSAAPPEGEPVEIIPVSGVRGLISDRMSLSHSQTAPVTLTTEVDATALVELRGELANDGIESTYNDLLLCILARALREHPRLNASLDGDNIKLWRDVHIAIAVDTDRGLLAPVIRNVEHKGLEQISLETKSLIDRARQGKCTPEELRGGTFTVTNLGMFGIDAFTPLIQLPECAILGVGRIKTQPVMLDNAVVGRQMVWLSLTFDHRLVDGGPAARFLQRVAQLIERPHLLIT